MRKTIRNKKRCLPLYQYFEGWYVKQQNTNETVALIPAFHVDSNGTSSASLQVITDTETYCIPFPSSHFYVNRKKMNMHLGQSTFSKCGCVLDAESEQCRINGVLYFHSFRPPAYNIMGPFSIFSFMECHHSVFSLFHRVEGCLTINGKDYVFHNGKGYMEGDRGMSFPKRYVWTHCSAGNNSIMLSVADIPFGRFSFVGCIGFIYWNKKEYRIATYCGVRLLSVSNDTIILKQGKLLLKIKMLSSKSQLLYAPDKGSMSRFIRESPSCRVQYTCTIGGRTLFDFVSEQASFENNW